MKPDEPLIGVINAGSSSLKFSFYEGAKCWSGRERRAGASRHLPACGWLGVELDEGSAKACSTSGAVR